MIPSINIAGSLDHLGDALSASCGTTLFLALIKVLKRDYLNSISKDYNLAMTIYEDENSKE
jgi:hypothetical protein